jgi:hypothetical protein
MFSRFSIVIFYWFSTTYQRLKLIDVTLIAQFTKFELQKGVPLHETLKENPNPSIKTPYKTWYSHSKIRKFWRESIPSIKKAVYIKQTPPHCFSINKYLNKTNLHPVEHKLELKTP